MNHSIIFNAGTCAANSSFNFEEEHTSKYWETTLFEAFELANSANRISTAPEEWSLAEVVWPVAEMVTNPVLSIYEKLVEEGHIKPRNAEKIFSDLVTPLWKSIFEAVSRSMTVELAAAKDTGLLPGNSDIERYKFFIECLKDPEFSLQLITQWPPLCELVIQICENWKTATISFLSRLRNDWPLINSAFYNKKHNGIIVNVSPSQGDTHRCGQSVVIIELMGGKKFVYKPRSVATELHFGSFVRWFNEVAGQQLVKSVNAIDLKNYGWCEFISQSPIKNKPDLHKYHKRLGALLAIARVLRITDLHSENIVADGDWPVLIDLETIFHPLENNLRPQLTLTTSERKLAHTLANSVQSTGLLPTRSFNELANESSLDLAGMADVEGKKIPFEVPAWEKVGTDEMRLGEISHTMEGNRNVPVYHGERIKVEDFKADVISGFSLGHSILANNKQQLKASNGPLEIFRNDEIRVVLRATQFYAQLLVDGSHPDLSFDFDEKENWLKTIIGNQETSHIEGRLISSELSALWRNDVPYFETTPLSRDIIDCSNQTHKDVLPETGWESSQNIIENLSNDDLDFQLWLIDAALSEVQSPENANSTSDEMPEYLPAETETLARHLVDQTAKEVCKFATVQSGHASWLTVNETQGGTLYITPAGLDLYSGLPGIALFLGKAGTCLQNPDYKKIGRAALQHILFKIKSGEADDLSNGGFSGKGGLIFALINLLPDYPDLPLLEVIHGLLEMTSDKILEETSLEVVDGLAGLSLSLVSAINNLTEQNIEADAEIAKITKLLLETCHVIQKTVEQYSDPKLLFGDSFGMAHGLLGLKTAMTMLLENSNFEIQESAKTTLSVLSKFVEAKNATQACCGSSIQSVAWCRGISGELLGEFLVHRSINQSLLTELLDSITEGSYADDSMCHGSLGALHVVNSLREYLSEEQLNQLKEATLLILHRAHKYGASAGTIGNVFSPGFMDGHSGIGFAALSLVFTNNVPAALVLGAQY